MTEISTTLFRPPGRGHWIRLRTLILLRWWAIFGQTAALITAQRLLDLTLEVGLCYMVIGVSVLTNLVASFLYPENKRLTERETRAFVLYDLLQLGLMLYLTGGLHNPFSILIVGPVLVSASALSSRSTVMLGLIAILMASLLSLFHLPLRTEQGFILRIPNVFLYGTLSAIVISVVFMGVYARWVVSEMRSMSEALQATQMALSREQKLTDLGGVVAAAAHELGTPLATIKLASGELAEELTDNEDLREDALLIRDQADRCRDILRSMGRAGKDDLQLHVAPLSTLLEEAAEPHLDRGKAVEFLTAHHDGASGPQPRVLREPEIIHGLRNLIQNAVDFAQSTVWIESEWTKDRITIRVMDDGRGFPPSILGQIGEPFMRRRNEARSPKRPGYEGMGLGLFIAKTLLERTGAELSFANGNDAFEGKRIDIERAGAIVDVSWPRTRLEAPKGGLGQNVPITG